MQGAEGSGPGTTGLGSCPRNEAHSVANLEWARLEAVFMNYERMPTPFPSGLLPAETPSVGEDKRGPTVCSPGPPVEGDVPPDVEFGVAAAPWPA